ncbi:MAG TPA: helix-turn-helix domain-containing protein [Jatrophihabitantaceae bacterium]|nr:helix-turn-helix domain-containing protein [Jatrophihabitantaceae bacterium]
MTKPDVLRADPQPEAALGDSRARVLGVLQDAGTPLGVADVSEAVGLHPNTTRFHLDGLVDAGLVQRATEERETPGRPRTLYSARPEAGRAGPRSYRLLAEILTSYLASQSRQPVTAALAAGTEWGRYLARRPAPFRRVTAEQATADLVRVLDEIGFAPEAVTVGRKRRVLLHHCPFREAAEQHREVVCSVHLGLMRGLLEESGAPLQAERLDPFVEPSLCVTHLAARAAKAG